MLFPLFDAYITWNIAPELFTIKVADVEIPITWYGLFFASGFLLGQQLLYYIFRHDGKPVKDVDTLTLYVIGATIVGARLGHYLFYEWQWLLTDPLQWFKSLIMPPFAGLASHGGVIAVVISLYLYSRKKPDQSFLWVTDRIAIIAPLAGALIRLGNLFNSEIYGRPTALPWGFLFENEIDPALLPLVPRHPTQLYESVFCLFLLGLAFYCWKHKRNVLPEGFITGLFFILLFTFRFLVEFLKNDQADFEKTMMLNMGQLLSIPVIAIGIIILVIAYRNKNAQKVIASHERT